MFEADGVDGGAICKRGFIHLQFAEKSEAPEAERHLGSRILEVPVSPRISTCSNLHAMGPGSVILSLRRNLMRCKYYRANSCTFQNLFENLFHVILRYISHDFIHLSSDLSSKGSFHNRLLYANTGRIGRTLTPVSAGTDVVFSGANKSPTLVGPQMQQPPSGGTWVGNTCDISRSMS
ncbi:LOW QUALITY PROTEIN: hypothetical protein V1477_002419 [Vespula maculifrons]|uniref:Uncharacterized protein n=1 Tax=Vespula maculifrons TaxID=7453 RepID=A0ABD2CXK1_VESMC